MADLWQRQQNFDPCTASYTTLEFFRPPASDTGIASDTYRIGDAVPILFNGGKNNSGTLVVSLYIQSVINGPFPYGPNVTILKNRGYTNGAEGKSSWYESDGCGNTAVSYNWTIPSNFDLGDGPNFRFVASSHSHADNSGSSNSGLIAIKSAARNASSIPRSTSSSSHNKSSAPTSTTTSISTSVLSSTSSTPTAKPPKPDSLSKGAQAGIGTGCSIVILSLILGIFYLFKRRKNRGSLPDTSGSGNAFEKPELEGKVARNQIEEIGGGEPPEMAGDENEQPIRELDGRAKARPPVELEEKSI